MTRHLVNIYLHGALGDKFGEKWTLNVSCVAEALRAIDVNTKRALTHYLFSQGYDGAYRIYLKNEDNHLTREELRNPVGTNDIHVVPLVGGRNSGWGKIAAGVVLIAATLAISYFSYSTINLESSAVPSAFAVAGNAAISIGISLTLGGISQLLTPAPKQAGQLGSDVFQGTISAAQQGGSVPIVYGTALVKPTPICISFNNADISTTTLTVIGAVQINNIPGGGYEFTPAGTVSTQTNQVDTDPGD